MKSKKSSWFYRIAAFLAGILIIILLVSYAGFQQFYETVLSISYYWLSIAITIFACSWIFKTWRIRQLTGGTISGFLTCSDCIFPETP